MSATNVASGIGGGETFVLGLVPSLAAMPGIECAMLVPHGRETDLRARVPGSVEVIPVTAHRGALRVGRDAIGLEPIIRKWRADVFHYPHEWAPRAPCPVVLTVQNVAFIHPETERAFGARGRLVRVMMERTAHRAAAVGAVSSSAADLWLRATRYRGPVQVIPEGFREADHLEPPPVTNPYCLLVTGPYAYKNSELGVEGYRQARAAGLGLELRVAGASGADEPDIRYCGWLSRPELLAVLQQARVTIFPSSVESFGLPALESVAMGTPCIFLKGTAMEEWLGDQGVAVDRAPSSIASALLAVDRRPSEPVGLPGDRFDWNTIAAEWAELYRGAVRG